MNAISNAVVSAATASLDYQSFKKAMVNVCKVVEKSCAIPALASILIKATPGGASVIGTDLDIHTTTFVPGEVTPGFAALVDAHRLKATMDKVKDAPTITIISMGKQLAISVGKLNLTLDQSVPLADFPAATDWRESLTTAGSCFVLPSATLAAMLDKVSFCISAEETRYYLNGIFMHLRHHEQTLSFAATDGHRLARFDTGIPAGAGELAGAIIPRAAARELQRLLNRKGRPSETFVSVSAKAVSFLVGEDELIESQLVDGEFPDYGRVIPTGNPNTVGVQTAAFVDALAQACSIVSDRGKGVVLTFSHGGLKISCQAPDFGTASTEIRLDGGFDLEIGFNASYLLDILKRLEGGAMLELGDPGLPCVIRDGADDRVSFTLMPMRI